jgi:hypothetical protein
MGNGGKDFHPFVVRQPRMVSILKVDFQDRSIVLA